jgi:hypothetical protein
MHKHAAEHGMLDDVGKISGVIGVSVVHRARLLSARDFNRKLFLARRETPPVFRKFLAAVKV